jgi:hypothetical protein
VPLVGFHDGSPNDNGETDKQNRFDDHVFNTFRPSIEDRPATVAIKSGPQPEAILLTGDATFLQRLLIGWNRSSVAAMTDVRFDR